MANEMVIHIPQRLAGRIASSGLRIDLRDSLAVMTWLIASRSQRKHAASALHI